MELKCTKSEAIALAKAFKSHLYGIEICKRLKSHPSQYRFKSHLYGIEIFVIQKVACKQKV